MTIALERAFVLLSIVEKAGSHNYIRAEALNQLHEMDMECCEVAKKRQEEADAKAAKEAGVKAAEAEKLRQEEAKQAKAEADRERKAPDPRLERPPQVDPATSTEPQIERRV